MTHMHDFSKQLLYIIQRQFRSLFCRLVAAFSFQPIINKTLLPISKTCRSLITS